MSINRREILRILLNGELEYLEKNANNLLPKVRIELINHIDSLEKDYIKEVKKVFAINSQKDLLIIGEQEEYKEGE